MASYSASVLHGPQDLRIEQRELDPLGPRDLEVEIVTTGLCGSDLHYFQHYRNGDIIVREPLTLGHESAGVVRRVGGAVLATEFCVGDRVALEVGEPCDGCEYCFSGRYNLCPRMRFRSSAKAYPHAQGTLQERVIHPARWCYKLPANVDFEAGALVEPLSVALHARRRVDLREHARVLVLGAGAVGMLVGGVLRERGSAVVVIADIDHGRVDFAVSNHFADIGHKMTANKSPTVEEQMVQARTATEHLLEFAGKDEVSYRGYDAVFECTGVPSCVQTAIFAARPGGKVVLIGMGHPIQTLPISAAALREVDILGSFRYANCYADSIELLASNSTMKDQSPQWKRLITHRFVGLKSLEEAFEMAAKTKDASGAPIVKVVIHHTGTSI